MKIKQLYIIIYVNNVLLYKNNSAYMRIMNKNLIFLYIYIYNIYMYTRIYINPVVTSILICTLNVLINNT